MDYMLTSDEECIAKEWDKYKGYTVRPLPSTSLYYEKIIQSFSQNNKFMMYGGTPEIRTIFQHLDRHVDIVDKSEKVVRSMGRLTLANAPLAKNENFININWLELASINNKFDLLIGDDAINMVAWDDFDLFLTHAYQILNDDGLFICHLLVKPDDRLINQGFVEVLNEYQAGSIKSHYDLASRLNFICFDKTNYAMGWQQTIEMIGKDRLGYFKPKFDFIDIFGLCNSKFYCPPQLKFEKLIQKYFIIEEVFYPHEHEYCLFEPVYVLKKR